MTGIEPHLDERGYPRAGVPPDVAMLSSFLEGDLPTPDAAEVILQAIEAVQSGERDAFQGTGNLYFVDLAPTHAKVTHIFDERSLTFPLAEFAVMVQQWNRFLKKISSE